MEVVELSNKSSTLLNTWFKCYKQYYFYLSKDLKNNSSLLWGGGPVQDCIKSSAYGFDPEVTEFVQVININSFHGGCYFYSWC